MAGMEQLTNGWENYLLGAPNRNRMPGKRSSSNSMQYLGAVVAGIAVLGYVVFDWSFGDANGIVPFAIGASVAILAIGITLYKRLYSSDDA
jgi:hypothetical protein